MTNNKFIITQNDLIDEIAKYTNFDSKQVKTIIDALSEFTTNYVDYCNILPANTEVVVDLFRGLAIHAKKIPEKEYILHGKKIIAKPRIKVNAKLSRYFNRTIVNGLEC